MQQRPFLPLTFALLLFTVSLNAQNVGINNSGALPDPSAMLDIESTTGGILIPRMSSTKRGEIEDPATGLLVYDNSLSAFYFYNGTAWQDVRIDMMSLSDLDGDTEIHVEKSPDDDAIRLEVPGDNYLKISTSATGQLLLEPYTFGNNLFLGQGAGRNTENTGVLFEGRNNTFLGYEAGNDNTLGNSNTFVGNGSGDENLTGADNTYVGSSAGGEQNTGDGNTAVGRAANFYNVSGEKNTIIGAYAGRGLSTHSKSGNVFIGYNAGRNEVVDNKLIIDNGTGPLISGDFTNNTVRIDGELAIGNLYRLPYTGNAIPGKILKNDGSGTVTWQNDEVEDNDSSPNNEIQSLSKVGNTVTLSNGGGSFTDEGGYLTIDNNTLHLAANENSTDFLFGRTSMPANGESVTDRFLMYDNSKYAFRGGQLSNSDAWSPANVGSSSFAFGFNTIASGPGSFAIGNGTSASGSYSFSGGRYTSALSGYEIALGRYNTIYTPVNTFNWDDSDRLFVIGNGSSSANRQDALSIMKNGATTLRGSLTMTDGSSAYTLPNTAGSKNQVLRLDGNSDLYWSDVDLSESNELQNLTFFGGFLTLSNGGGTANLLDLQGLWSENFTTDLLSTNNSISVGTSNKVGNVNIFGGSEPAELNLTTATGGNSEVRFSENADGTTGMGWRYDGGHDRMELFSYVSGTESSTLKFAVKRSNGDIAIGGSKFATDHKLSVNGKIACEEVLVELDGNWPDYVFASNYELRSIEELETYIDKEKHLPGIAPASEIEENGLKVGDMQKNLMEKVEELSLYIIQLNKANKDLQERISTLEKAK